MTVRATKRSGDQPRLMQRVCVTMFVAGGLLSLSTVWFPGVTDRWMHAHALAGATLVITGLLLLTGRPPRWLLQASVFWSIVVLCALVAVSEPVGAAGSFFLWPVLVAAYFCSRRVALVTLVWAALGLALGLLLNHTQALRIETFIGSMGAVVVVGFLVAAMTDRERRLRAALTQAADIDPLTGLLNRRSLDSRLDALVRDAANRGRPLSLVMFDLDHFKRVNDRYGHLAGDAVLRQFGIVLAAQSREDDLVARFGGEEFTAVLPGVPLADARRYAERVAAALARVGSVAGAIPVPTLSAGLASLAPGLDTVDDFLRHADSALYAAKEGGRCRLGVWGPVIEVAPPFLRPGRPAEITEPVEVAIWSPAG